MSHPSAEASSTPPPGPHTGPEAMPRLNSRYLEHLAQLARETRARQRDLPAFDAMLALALLLHVAVLGPLLWLWQQEPPPQTRYVRLRFGEARDPDAPARNTAPKPGSPTVTTAPTPKPDSGPSKPEPTQTPTREETPTGSKQPSGRAEASAAPESAPETAPVPTLAPSRPYRSADAFTPGAPARYRSPIPGRNADGRRLRSTRVPSAAPVAGSLGEDVARRYEQLLSGWINSHRHNRNVAVPDRRGGRVVVRIRINRRGGLIFSTIERSSGQQAVDQAALKAVERAEPLPPAPVDYPGGGQLEFLVPITILDTK